MDYKLVIKTRAEKDLAQGLKQQDKSESKENPTPSSGILTASRRPHGTSRDHLHR